MKSGQEYKKETVQKLKIWANEDADIVRAFILKNLTGLQNSLGVVSTLELIDTVEAQLRRVAEGEEIPDLLVQDNDLSTKGGFAAGLRMALLYTLTNEELDSELKQITETQTSSIFSGDELKNFQERGVDYVTALQKLKATEKRPFICLYTDLAGVDQNPALGSILEKLKGKPNVELTKKDPLLVKAIIEREFDFKPAPQKPKSKPKQKPRIKTTPQELTIPVTTDNDNKPVKVKPQEELTATKRQRVSPPKAARMLIQRSSSAATLQKLYDQPVDASSPALSAATAAPGQDRGLVSLPPRLGSEEEKTPVLESALVVGSTPKQGSSEVEVRESPKPAESAVTGSELGAIPESPAAAISAISLTRSHSS